MTGTICTASGDRKRYQVEACTCGSPDCPDYEIEPEVPQWPVVRFEGEDMDRLILTDESMITDAATGKKVYEFRDVSTKFACPACPTGAIPHTNRNCPDCGTAVAIDSEYVRGQIEKRRKK